MLVVGYFPRYVPLRLAGSEVTAHAFMAPLAAVGHEVHVILGEQEGDEYDLDGVHVHPRVDFRRDILKWVPQADLVFTQQEMWKRATILARSYRIASASFVHSKWTARNYGDLTVYNTNFLANEYGAGHHNIVCHPWIDPEDYRVDGPGDAVTLVNLWEGKGSATFYEMAKRFPDQKFLGVIGGYAKQTIRTDLPNVEIREQTTDMRQVYRDTKVLLMPSWEESYGRVAVEAAVSGIPSIVAPTEGLVEAMGDGALYAPQEDFDGYEKHLAKLLGPRGYQAASKRAKARAKQIESERMPEIANWVATAEDIAKRLKGAKR